MTDMPLFRLINDGKHGRLIEAFTYETPFKGGFYKVRNLVLEEDGTLWVGKGYIWDFASGPAIDTPAMVYGSLAHDALYDMMNSGTFPKKNRRAVDKWFISLLKDAGVSWIRRQWVYLGIRLGYPIWKAFR